MQLEAEARAIESFRKRPRVLRLECGAQHYDWGDLDTIPGILDRPNPQRRPFAELWAGAHPDLPSQAIVEGVRVPLDLLIQEASGEILGPDTAARFQGKLPFLLKILAAAKPLSIQAHPNRAQALLGFERENRVGRPLDAATRNYRDPYHKPELLVALSEFYALRGFRPYTEITQALTSTPELTPLTGDQSSNANALATLYGRIMRLDQSEVNAILGPLVDRLERQNQRVAFSRADRAYWILAAHREFSTPGRIDRGLFSILLLNLVRLRPGQGIFLDAGELHAYLQGAGIEIMANSNNVLRGGLTTKHVDTQELLNVLTFRGGPGEVLEPRIHPDTPWLEEYETPAAEFALGHLKLDPRQTRALPAGEIRLGVVGDGSLDVADEGVLQLEIRPGGALLVPAGVGCEIWAPKGGQLWLAKVPDDESRTTGR